MNSIERLNSQSPEYREIPLTLGKFALVDAADYDYVMRWRWHACRRPHTWYAARHEGKKKVYLHRQLLGFPKGKIDHMDSNGLHCYRSNMREATNQQNGQNQRLKRNNSSGFKGVSLDKNREMWKAYISVKGRQIYLGRFTDAVDAALAYDKAARAYFGAFASTNFPGVKHGLECDASVP